MSKMLAGLVLAAATLGAPVLSFAQSTAPLTRAEVRADLVRVEQAGYTPSSNDINYPADIQAAEAKIAAQNDQQMTNQAVGGVAQNGSSSSGMITRSAGGACPCLRASSWMCVPWTARITVRISSMNSKIASAVSGDQYVGMPNAIVGGRLRLGVGSAQSGQAGRVVLRR